MRRGRTAAGWAAAMAATVGVILASSIGWRGAVLYCGAGLLGVALLMTLHRFIRGAYRATPLAWTAAIVAAALFAERATGGLDGGPTGGGLAVGGFAVGGSAGGGFADGGLGSDGLASGGLTTTGLASEGLGDGGLTTTGLASGGFGGGWLDGGWLGGGGAGDLAGTVSAVQLLCAVIGLLMLVPRRGPRRRFVLPLAAAWFGGAGMVTGGLVALTGMHGAGLLLRGGGAFVTCVLGALIMVVSLVLFAEPKTLPPAAAPTPGLTPALQPAPGDAQRARRPVRRAGRVPRPRNTANGRSRVAVHH